MKETPKIYIIKQITDHNGKAREDGRYPLRIGRRFAFGLGEPSPSMVMAICYRPRQNDDYSGTLRTSIVQKVERIEEGTVVMTNKDKIFIFCKDGMIVTTKNSIYYFQEEE